MSAGYSKKSLANKLGIRDGTKVLFVNPPPQYRKLLGTLPHGIAEVSPRTHTIDFIHAFVTSMKEMGKLFPRLKKTLAKDGILWISWPKKTSGLATDLDGNTVRMIGLDGGLVDVKVAAIDETWSGLKFVYRLKDRGDA